MSEGMPQESDEKKPWPGGGRVLEFKEPTPEQMEKIRYARLLDKVRRSVEAKRIRQNRPDSEAPTQ